MGISPENMARNFQWTWENAEMLRDDMAIELDDVINICI